MRSAPFWLSPLALLFLNGCAQPAPVGPSGIASERERNARIQEDYQQIEGLIGGGADVTAEGAIETFLKQGNLPGYTGRVLAWRGEIRRRRKKFQLAAEDFRAALSRKVDLSQPDPNWVLLRQALAEQELGAVARVEGLLAEIDRSRLTTSDRTDYHLLRLSTLVQEANPSKILAEIFEGVEQSPRDSGRFARYVATALEKIEEPEAILSLIAGHERRPLADRIVFEAIARLWAQGQPARAKVLGTRFLQLYPESPLLAEVRRKTLGPEPARLGGAPVIGLLLPLSGKNKELGGHLRQAIELGMGRNDFEFAVEDSLESSDDNLAAYQRLVEKKQALAVIGPVRSGPSQEIAEKATTLGVPTLLITRKRIEKQGYALQMGVTDDQQAQTLAHAAVKEKRLRRFALIGPGTPAGESALQIYWDAIERAGGVVRAYETYEPDAQDFQGLVAKLTGMDDLGGRANESGWSAKKAKKPRRGLTKKMLPPVVDFDALWIVDQPKVASLILPVLPFLDLPPFPVFGTASWNLPEFLTSIQNTRHPIVFADSVEMRAPSSLMRRFRDLYRSKTGRFPSPLETAVYDTASLLKKALSTQKARATRENLRQAILALDEWEGVTGTLKVDDEGIERKTQAIVVPPTP